MTAQELAPGKWNLTGSENFDNYLKEIGVGPSARKVAANTQSRQSIYVSLGEWTIETTHSRRSFLGRVSHMKNTSIKFTPGKEVVRVTSEGREIKSTFTFKGNQLIEDQKGQHDATITRTFEKAKMTMLFSANKVTASRYFSRVTN